MTLLDDSVRSNVRLLLSMIPGIRDADPDAVHDARVATRRLRAALPIACGRQAEHVTEAIGVVRKAGRALGRARDVAVILEQLRAANSKLPGATRAIGSLQQRFEKRQLKERRNLIKSFEELQFGSLTTVLACRPSSWMGDPRWVLLERAVIEHVERLRERVTAASGVYFPNRAHKARVDLKKLRYVLELIPHAATKPALKRLRRVQEVLGRVHDCQSLMDAVQDATQDPSAGEEYEALRALVRAEVHELYSGFVSQRKALLETLEGVHRATIGHAWRPSNARRWLLAGALAAPPLGVLVRGSYARRTLFTGVRTAAQEDEARGVYQGAEPNPSLSPMLVTVSSRSEAPRRERVHRSDI